MYRYIFSFTLKLITILLKNLAIFSNIESKTKGYGLAQNTLHCCYDEYVATNQQT